MRKLLILLTLVISALVMAGFITCANANNPISGNDTPGENGNGAPGVSSPLLGPNDFIAYFVDTPPTIDGVGDDAAWANAQWQPIKYEWMYETGSLSRVKGPQDFSGHFKVVWTADRLYILAEIIDDVISTTNTNPYVSPENNDCLEIFIDENASGGPRGNENGSNFFTYHLSFNGNNAADYIGPPNNTSTDPTLRIENGFILRNSHFNYVIHKNNAAHTYTWELEMKVYDNTYPARSNPDTTPVTLTDGKKIGFAAAYCDADAKSTREHFIGSMFVTGSTDDQRNSSYKDSTQYAKMYLMKSPAAGNSVVSLVRSSTAQASNLIYNDILALTREAIELTGGLGGIIKQGDVVVLKPNLICTIYNWGTSGASIPALANGVTTDWRVVQAVSQIVREIIGPTGKIMVMEGPGKSSVNSLSSIHHFNNMGYTRANLTYVDEIIALDTEGTYVGAGNATGSAAYVSQVTLPDPFYTGAAGKYLTYYKNDGKYWVNKKMLEADALICIPVVKSHWNATVTGAVKNIGIGAAPPTIYGIGDTDAGRNDMVNHSSVLLQDWIADYFSCLPADFVVMDGLQGLENGPLPWANSEATLAVHQKNLRCILASRDALAIDMVEANIIGWDYTSVPYLTKLTAKGEVFARGEIGKPNARKIPLRGEAKDIVVLGNVQVDDVRGDYDSINQDPNNPGIKISAEKQTKPAVTINSAAFSGSSLNLNLALSTGAYDNVVKIDVYIDGAYAASFNNNMNVVSLNASGLAAGSHHIEVRAYTNYMYSTAAAAAANK